MTQSLLYFAAAAAVIAPLAIWTGVNPCPSGQSACSETTSLVAASDPCADKSAACGEKASAVSTAERAPAGSACCPGDAASKGSAALVSTGAAAPFDALKALAGRWKVLPVDGAPDGGGEIEFKVSSGGSAIVETMFPGTAQEMTNVYVMDGDQLLVTHYCAAGNAPRMKLTRHEGGAMKFEFLDATNLRDKSKMYMGQLELQILGPDQIRQTWTSFVNGQPDPNHASFTLERVK